MSSHPPPGIWIDAARPKDLQGIRGLLDSSELPGSDVTETGLRCFRVARATGGLAGVVGLEVQGEVALLRSLVVAADHRGRGLGEALLAEALEVADGAGCHSVYLLTTTAAAFFGARGFHTVPREHVPPGIKATTQFSTLCPSTAIVMVKS